MANINFNKVSRLLIVSAGIAFGTLINFLGGQPAYGFALSIPIIAVFLLYGSRNDVHTGKENWASLMFGMIVIGLWITRETWMYANEWLTLSSVFCMIMISSAIEIRNMPSRLAVGFTNSQILQLLVIAVSFAYFDIGVGTWFLIETFVTMTLMLAGKLFAVGFLSWFLPLEETK